MTTTPTFDDPDIEETAYAQALEEISTGNVRSGIWAKAIAESEGDEAKTKARYIALRVHAELAMIASQVASLQSNGDGQKQDLRGRTESTLSMPDDVPNNFHREPSFQREGTTESPTCTDVSNSDAKFFGPIESVVACLDNYAVFSGCAARSEYWWFNGISLMLEFIAAFFFWPIGILVFAVLLGLPGLSSTVRRLRDAGKNPWFVLLRLLHIPGELALMYLCIAPSKDRATTSDTLPINAAITDPTTRISAVGASEFQRVANTEVVPDEPSTYTIVSSVIVFVAVVILAISINGLTNKQESSTQKMEMTQSPEPPSQPENLSQPELHEFTSWSPENAQQRTSGLKFPNGFEIRAVQTEPLSGGVLRYRKSLDSKFVDAPIANDFVSLVGALPSIEKPKLAIIRSSCGGVVCDWNDYHIVHPEGDRLNIWPIGSVYNRDFQIKLETNGEGLMKVFVSGVANGTLNVYGDLVKSDLNLVREFGFVHSQFNSSYYALVGADPEAFFSHSMAREKLFINLKSDVFRELRSYLSSQTGKSKLVGGRYVVFNGCKLHVCATDSGTLIFDGVTGDAWAVWIDNFNRKFSQGNTAPWTGDLVEVLKPHISPELEVEPKLDNGHVKLVRIQK